MIGYTAVGSDTVYLGPVEVDQEALNDMQERLPLCRLLVGYDMKFETDGFEAMLLHQRSDHEVRVNIEGAMPFLDDADYEQLKRVVREWPAHRTCGCHLLEDTAVLEVGAAPQGAPEAGEEEQQQVQQEEANDGEQPGPTQEEPKAE